MKNVQFTDNSTGEPTSFSWKEGVTPLSTEKDPLLSLSEESHEITETVNRVGYDDSSVTKTVDLTPDLPDWTLLDAITEDVSLNLIAINTLNLSVIHAINDQADMFKYTLANGWETVAAGDHSSEFYDLIGYDNKLWTFSSKGELYSYTYGGVALTDQGAAGNATAINPVLQRYDGTETTELILARNGVAAGSTQFYKWDAIEEEMAALGSEIADTTIQAMFTRGAVFYAVTGAGLVCSVNLTTGTLTPVSTAIPGAQIVKNVIVPGEAYVIAKNVPTYSWSIYHFGSTDWTLFCNLSTYGGEGAYTCMGVNESLFYILGKISAFPNPSTIAFSCLIASGEELGECINMYTGGGINDCIIMNGFIYAITTEGQLLSCAISA